eukprot:maker-scaffold206_size259025-snap-gene-0.12 protein:Tk10928 transcript:maker-scaffold206_size259025-snap-gene-0.12-mRNA-1 annotation:"l-fucose kinase"
MLWGSVVFLVKPKSLSPELEQELTLLLKGIPAIGGSTSLKFLECEASGWTDGAVGLTEAIQSFIRCAKQQQIAIPKSEVNLVITLHGGLNPLTPLLYNVPKADGPVPALHFIIELITKSVESGFRQDGAGGVVFYQNAGIPLPVDPQTTTKLKFEPGMFHEFFCESSLQHGVGPVSSGIAFVHESILLELFNESGKSSKEKIQDMVENYHDPKRSLILPNLTVSLMDSFEFLRVVSSSMTPIPSGYVNVNSMSLKQPEAGIEINSVFFDSCWKPPRASVMERLFFFGFDRLDLNEDVVGKDFPEGTVLVCLPLLNGMTSFVQLHSDDPWFAPLRDSKALYQQVPLQSLEEAKIWPFEVKADQRCLFRAKLFPVFSNKNELRKWFGKDLLDHPDRMSLEDIFDNLDIASVLQRKRTLTQTICLENIIDKGRLPSVMEINAFHYDDVSNMDELIKNLVQLGQEKEITRRYVCRVFLRLSQLCSIRVDNDAFELKLLSVDLQSRIKEALTDIRVGNYASGLEKMETIRHMSKEDFNKKWNYLAHFYDKAIEVCVSSATMAVQESVSVSKTKSLPPINYWVTTTAPARIDMTGAWTDTPPICSDFGGHVVGIAIAIDGERPIGCKVRRIQERSIRFTKKSFLNIQDETWSTKIVSKLNDYANPKSKFALVKACLSYCCAKDLSKPILDSHLFEGFESGLEVVLIVEQLLTTGGGWQDQVNGLLPGIKIGISESKEPLSIDYEIIPCRDQFIKTLEDHMVLIYTGKVRLAKNLLSTVVRAWYSDSEDIVSTLEKNYSLAPLMASALKKENLPEIGRILDECWKCKKILATGSEPPSITKIFEATRHLCHGQTLPGAGGGGFIVALTREPHMASSVRELLLGFEATVHSVEIDQKGIQVMRGLREVILD